MASIGSISRAASNPELTRTPHTRVSLAREKRTIQRQIKVLEKDDIKLEEEMFQVLREIQEIMVSDSKLPGDPT